MSDFKIDGLDHVAIRVENLEISALWYKKFLGLKIKKTLEWGAFPIFLLANKTGVALFPKNAQEDKVKSAVDHFAFRLSNNAFEKAKSKWTDLGLEYKFRDHIYFHSIYTKDPDDHIVELTTLIEGKEAFYD